MSTKALVFFLLFFPSNCFATETLETTADEVQIDTKLGTCTLSGNAVAKYDNKIFKADKIVVFKEESEKAPSQIVATGKVLYIDGKNSITSANCECNMISVIFSNGVTINGPDFGKLEADKAIYNIKTKKVDLISSKKVKLTLCQNVESKITSKTKR